MKPVHFPRRSALLFLVLLAAGFLGGNVMAFSSHASATQAGLVPTMTGTLAPSPTLTATAEGSIASADTTGILILGILLVAILLIGLLWGGRLGRK
jgi:hypothetical protein